MRILQLALVLLLPLLGTLPALLSFERLRSPRDALLYLLLGSGAGIGLTSAAYFAWSLLFNPAAHLGWFWGLLAALYALLGVAWVRRARLGSGWFAWQPAARPGWAVLGLGTLLGVIACFSFAAFVLSVQAEPRGGWDAIAIWNAHARFMYLGHADWLVAFSPQRDGFSHPDYPYLLPGILALGWSILGKMLYAVPNLVALFYTFASGGLLLLGLARLRDLRQGLLAAIVLLSAPEFILIGSKRIADIPLGFYILAVCLVSALYLREGSSQPKLLALTGFLMGCAIWTKNDGWNLLLAFGASWILAAFLARQSARLLREIPWMLLGLAPLLLLVIYFKFAIAPPGDLTGLAIQQGPAALFGRLFDVERYRVTLAWFADQLWVLGGWKVSLPLLAGLYLALNGLERQARRSREALTLGIFLVLALLGYFFVYILTPHDLVWHLSTSLVRLLMQLLPAFLLFLFYIANPVPDFWPGRLSTLQKK